MNTTIVVTDNIKLEFSKGTGANVGTYSPVVFRKGGHEVRNPGTGLTQIAEDKWVDIPLYFTNLVHALRWCAQEAANIGDEVGLEQHITRCEAVWKQ